MTGPHKMKTKSQSLSEAKAQAKRLAKPHTGIRETTTTEQRRWRLDGWLHEQTKRRQQRRQPRLWAQCNWGRVTAKADAKITSKRRRKNKRANHKQIYHTRHGRPSKEWEVKWRERLAGLGFSGCGGDLGEPEPHVLPVANSNYYIKCTAIIRQQQQRPAIKMATMRGLCSLLIPPSKRLQLKFKWCSECLSPLPPLTSSPRLSSAQLGPAMLMAL